MGDLGELPRLLKAGEVCSVLRCSRWVLKKLIRQKKLIPLRIGSGKGTLRFRKEDLEEFIRSSAAA